MTNLIFDRSFFWGWTIDPLRLGLTFWTTRYQLPGILSFTRWPRRRMAVKTHCHSHSQAERLQYDGGVRGGITVVLSVSACMCARVCTCVWCVWCVYTSLIRLPVTDNHDTLIIIIIIIIFISRLLERHKPIELATIKQQSSRKKVVKSKNTKSKKK